MRNHDGRTATWWLVCITILIILAGAGSAVYVWHSGARLYVGRVELKEKQQTRAGAAELKTRLANLAAIAKSERVTRGAWRTMGYLDVTGDPSELMSTLSIEPVDESQILRLEVASRSADEAKVAADVIAGELQKAYAEVMNEAGNDHGI